MNSSGADQPQSIPKMALVLLIIIVAVLALVSVFANVQRGQRSKIEKTIVTPANPSPTPAIR